MSENVLYIPPISIKYYSYGTIWGNKFKRIKSVAVGKGPCE